MLNSARILVPFCTQHPNLDSPGNPSALKMFRRGDQDSDSSDDEADQPKVSVDLTTSKPPSLNQGNGEETNSEDEGDLFGNMLDLPAADKTEDTLADTTSTIVTSREFPLPKHLPSAFALPKKLLSDLILSRKAMAPSKPNPSGESSEPEPKMVVTTFEYKEIGRGSRLKRCRLDIVYTPEGRSISKGNRHVAAVSRENGSAAPVTPASASGNATPASTTASSGQLSNLQTAVEGISSSTSSGEGPAGDNVIPSNTPAPAPPPSVLDDYTYMIQMESVGCPTTTEAENYIALIALHELTTSTNHSTMSTTKSANLGISSMTSPSSVALRMEYPPINARNLPAPYRDMWEELEAIRRIQEDEESRELWKGLDEVLKVQSNVEFGKEGKGEKSAVSQDKFGPVVT
jgi:hypothetical protein